MRWENASDQDFAISCTLSLSQGSFDVNFMVATIVDLLLVLSLAVVWVQESKEAEMISTAGEEVDPDHEEEIGKLRADLYNTA